VTIKVSSIRWVAGQDLVADGLVSRQAASYPNITAGCCDVKPTPTINPRTEVEGVIVVGSTIVVLTYPDVEFGIKLYPFRCRSL